MSKFNKVLNIAYYIFTLIVIFILYSMQYNNGLSKIFDDYLYGTPYFEITINVVVGIICIVTLIKILLILFKKSSDRYFRLFDVDGEVEVSDISIIKVAENTLNTFPEILEKSVYTKISTGKDGEQNIVLNLKCGLDEEVCKEEGFVYSDYCNDVQNTVHSSLEYFLGKTVEKVNIKFYDIKKVDIKVKEGESTRVDNTDKSQRVGTKKVFQEKKKRVN